MSYLAALLSLCLIVGCRSDGAEEKSDEQARPAETGETPQEGTSEPSTDQETDAEGDEPELEPLPTEPARAIGHWPDGYPPLLRDDSLMFALVRPEAIGVEIDRAVVALERLDQRTAAHARRAVNASLGDLKKLLDTTTWADSGLDADRPVLVQLTTGDGTHVAEAWDTTRSLVETPDDAADTPDLDAGVRRIALGLHVALPATDTDSALEFVGAALPAVATSDADAIELNGYDRVTRVGEHTLLGVRRQADFVILDAALLPWLTEASDGQRFERARAVLAGLASEFTPVGKPAPPGPNSFDALDVHVALDVDALARFNTVAMLAAGATDGDLDASLVRAVSVSERMLIDGPWASFTLSYGREKPIAVGAYFRQRQPALVEQLSLLQHVELDGAIARVDFDPTLGASDSVWARAGITSTEDVEVDALLAAVLRGEGVLPVLAPVWFVALPRLLWRDLVPVAARFVDIGELDRMAVVMDDSLGTMPAIAAMLIDRGGELETHRHGIACLSQRRPVQASCRDEKIELGTRSSTRFGRESLHYLIERRDEDIVVVGSLDETLFGKLADAKLAGTRSVASAYVDFSRLGAAGLRSVFGTTMDRVSSVLGELELDVTVDADGLHYALEFKPSVSLARIASLAGPILVDSLDRAREVEALLNLEAIGAGAVAHHEGARQSDASGRYPVAVEPICTAGGREDGERVPSTDTRWQTSPWKELGFSVGLPHTYRYCYQSSEGGERFAAWAEGALQTDGIDSRFCLRSARNQSGDAAVGSIERLDGDANCTVDAASPSPSGEP